MLEELKAAHREKISVSLAQELTEYKMEVFREQVRKAQLIVSKYEVLTREYQSQHKQFQERHVQIIDADQKKRSDIIGNFETHLQQIRQ